MTGQLKNGESESCQGVRFVNVERLEIDSMDCSSLMDDCSWLGSEG